MKKNYLNLMLSTDLFRHGVRTEVMEVTQYVYCWCMVTFWCVLRNFLFVTQLCYSVNTTSLENQGLTRFVSFGFVAILHLITFMAAEINGIIENLPFFKHGVLFLSLLKHLIMFSTQVFIVIPFICVRCSCQNSFLPRNIRWVSEWASKRERLWMTHPVEWQN